MKDEIDYDSVIKFKEYSLARKKKLTQPNYNFLTSRQDEADTFDNFVNKRKTLNHECELKESRNSHIKDMIIIETNDLRLQEKLLSETDLTLEMAIKAGQTTETASRSLTKRAQGSKFHKNGKKKPAKSR